MNLQTVIELLANRRLDRRIKFRGLDISIETDKGNVRQGVDKNGKKWKVTMTWPYGYCRMSQGTDGDHIDVFIGPNEKAKYVYVIHIKDINTGKYDEDKCMLGFNSAKEAKVALLENYNNPKFYDGMDILSFEEFKCKVLSTKNNPQKIVAMYENI